MHDAKTTPKTQLLQYLIVLFLFWNMGMEISDVWQEALSCQAFLSVKWRVQTTAGSNQIHSQCYNILLFYTISLLWFLVCHTTHLKESSKNHNKKKSCKILPWCKAPKPQSSAHVRAGLKESVFSECYVVYCTVVVTLSLSLSPSLSRWVL